MKGITERRIDGVIFGQPAKPTGFFDIKYPDRHGALSAILSTLEVNGLPSRYVNLWDGLTTKETETIQIESQIKLAKMWWKAYGKLFLAGQSVPNPNLLGGISYDDP